MLRTEIVCELRNLCAMNPRPRYLLDCKVLHVDDGGVRTRIILPGSAIAHKTWLPLFAPWLLHGDFSVRGSRFIPKCGWKALAFTHMPEDLWLDPWIDGSTMDDVIDTLVGPSWEVSVATRQLSFLAVRFRTERLRWFRSVKHRLPLPHGIDDVVESYL
jgi:hypothetical protein